MDNIQSAVDTCIAKQKRRRALHLWVLKNAHPVTAAFVSLHHPGFAVAGVPHTLKELHLPLKIPHQDQPLSFLPSAREGQGIHTSPWG